MTDLSDLIPSATSTTKVVHICMNGDLNADLEEARRALESYVEPIDIDMMGSGGDRARLQAAVDAATARVREASSPWRVRALPQQRWQAFQKKHKPRKGEAQDQMWGLNAETFPLALLRQTLVDPVVSDEPFELDGVHYASQWEWLDQHLDAGQFDALVGAALLVTRVPVDVPFSSSGSEQMAVSAAT